MFPASIPTPNFRLTTESPTGSGATVLASESSGQELIALHEVAVAARALGAPLRSVSAAEFGSAFQALLLVDLAGVLAERRVAGAPSCWPSLYARQARP